jgi:signal transduction histidine kinase
MTEPDKKDVSIASAEDNSQPGTSARRNPEDNDAEERIRAVVADYEARINEVADVIARVRHEINNPLTGVLGQAQLLLREDLSERARKRAETIEELAIRIRDIVALLRQIQKPLRSSGNNESDSV